MTFTVEDLAKRTLHLGAPSLSYEDYMPGGLVSGMGTVYPDAQTVSVQTYVENVPASWGGYPVDFPVGAPGPMGDPYTMIYDPPLAYLYWFGSQRLIRIDKVRYTEQYFTVPYVGTELSLSWVCPAPITIDIWRYYDPAFVL